MEEALGLRGDCCDEFVKTVLLKMCSLPLPQIEPSVNWPETFSPSSSNNEEAQLLLASLQRGREQVLSEFSHPHPTLESLKLALESYLPNVNLILESLNSQSTVAIKSAMVISWTGSFGGRRLANSAIIYELVMCFHSLAVVNYLEACQWISGEGYKDEESIKAAAKSFLQAGSVLIYLGDRILPRWTKAKSTSDIPEISTAVTRGFAHLCLCSAQQCVVLQSLRSGKSSNGVIAKLCSAVAKSSEDCLTTVSGDDENFQNLSSSIKEHLSFIKETFKAFSFIFQGKTSGKGGTAIGNFKAAIALLVQQGPPGGKERHDPFRSGLPNLNSSKNLSDAADSLGNLLTHLKDILETAEADNNIVYFEEIPVVTMPAPVHLANLNSMPYSPNLVGRIVMFAKESRAVNTEPKGATDKGEADATLGSFSPSVFNANDETTLLSDEELARNLQNQYDQENVS